MAGGKSRLTLKTGQDGIFLNFLKEIYKYYTKNVGGGICAIYFAKTRVKHNLKAVPFAAAGDIVGILMAVILIKLVKI